MERRAVLFTVLFVVVIFSVAFAKMPGRPPAVRLDKNRDGVVDRKEIQMEKSKVNTPWERKADTDKDGIVEKEEAVAWRQSHKHKADLNNDGVVDAKEKAIYWKDGKAKVNNPVEARYDVNGDGWLEPGEVRELIKDKHELIKTNGKARVDSPLEARYDLNGDGIIDAQEAKDMLK